MTTMDFFGQQRRARKRACALVACLALVVAVMITAIYLAVVLINVPGEDGDPQSTGTSLSPGYAYGAIATVVIVIASAMFCLEKLRHGEQWTYLGDLPKSIPRTESTDLELPRQVADATALVCFVIAAASLAAIYRFLIVGGEGGQPIQWIQPRLLIDTVGVTLAVLVAGSIYKTLELRRGDQLALMLGGQRINPATNVLAEQQLRNIVEEMAIASGLPVPQLYLLKNEFGINALAAGLTRDDAIVCVSQGALDYLNRDELQGVVAHEFSHILNGDMRFNLRLIGILHGILFIGMAGKYLTFAASGAYSETAEGERRLPGVLFTGPILLLGLALYGIGSAGLFAGRAIRAAVSRQREYLADASAVQFTRNPQSISGALTKIGGLATHSFLRTRHAESASHMFFERIRPFGQHSWFATHPPLTDRIRAVDTQFDGRFPHVQLLSRDQVKPRKQVKVSGSTAMGQGVSHRAAGDVSSSWSDLVDTMAADPAKIIAAVGIPTMDDIHYASQWLANLPEAIATAVREPFSARCVVFALLLDRRSETRRLQVQWLHDREGEPTRHETERITGQLVAHDRSCRLPLLVLAHASLRQLSASQYDQFRKSVTHLIRADQQVDLFEFVVSCVVLAQLDRAFGKQKPPQVRYYNVRGLVEEVAILLSALAQLGSRTPQAAEKALRQAVPALQLRDRAIGLLDARQCTLAQVQSALQKLATCSLPVKKRVLSSATLCVVVDGQVSVAEAELLRAVAIVLDCPMPPVIPGTVTKSA